MIFYVFVWVGGYWDIYAKRNTLEEAKALVAQLKADGWDATYDTKLI